MRADLGRDGVIAADVDLNRAGPLAVEDEFGRMVPGRCRPAEQDLERDELIACRVQA